MADRNDTATKTQHPLAVTRTELVQSKVEINRKTYLIRVMLNEKTAKVVTVYRTSKINKYWKT